MVRIFNLRFENQNMLMVIFPLLLIMVVSGVVYGAASYLLRIEEIVPVIRYVRRILLRKMLVK